MVDVIVISIILILVFFVVRGMIRDKAKGSAGCGCGCSSCSMAGQCKGNELKENHK